MKCLVHGSFMNDNYGDYLLYDITRREIEKYINKEDIYVDHICDFYKKFNEINSLNTYKAVFNCDKAVFTGGGYFGEPSGMLYKHYWNIRFLINHAMPALVLAITGRKYMFLGLGVGPLSWRISRRIAKYVFDKASCVLVRDEESKYYIKSILNVDREVYVYPDLVMGCNISNYLTEKEWAEKYINNKKKNIAIHLTSKLGTDTLKKVCGDIKEFLDIHGAEYNVFFIADQMSRSKKNRSEKISRYIQFDNVKFIEYNSPYKLTSFLSAMDIVITDKLHVGIVSTKLKKYVISVASHPKIRRFYKQIGRMTSTCNIKEVKAGFVFDLLQRYNDCEEQNDINVFENAAEKSLDKLKDFLQM